MDKYYMFQMKMTESQMYFVAKAVAKAMLGEKNPDFDFVEDFQHCVLSASEVEDG